MFQVHCSRVTKKLKTFQVVMELLFMLYKNGESCLMLLSLLDWGCFSGLLLPVSCKSDLYLSSLRLAVCLFGAHAKTHAYCTHRKLNPKSDSQETDNDTVNRNRDKI